MILHHPSDDLLKNFAEGNLDAALSSVVSAHVENCLPCQKSVGRFEEAVARKFFASHSEWTNLDKGLSGRNETHQAWLKVSSKLNASVNTRPYFEHSIKIDGFVFELPRSLRKFGNTSLKWMPFGKGGKICKLGDENKKSLFLIYLTSSEEVPLHSHEGSEYSYVISGSFAADGVEYKTGDFSISTPDVVHAPKAGAEDGCLLLSSVENRLNFLQGWLRPFNGFLWWILNLRARWM